MFSSTLRLSGVGFEVLDIGEPTYQLERVGRKVALTYMLEQMTAYTWVSLVRKVRRQKHRREIHARATPLG
jgi:hypothetical protein